MVLDLNMSSTHVCLHQNFQRPNRRSQNQNDPEGPTGDPKIKMTQMTPPKCQARYY
jgi:hypothetical protein